MQSFDTLSCIEANTGLTISYEKTCVYRIGSLANTNAKIYTQKDLQWTNDPISILGITVANSETVRLNYPPVIDKVKNTLDAWFSRRQTLMGKTLVVNVLCESLFVYRMSVLPDMPTQMLNDIDKVIYNYLWRGKKAKIAKNTLQSDKTCGGLRLCNLSTKQKALKIKWVNRILKDPLFNICFFDNVKTPKCDFLFECNLNVKHCKTYVNVNEFWGQVFVHWCEFNFEPPTDLTTVLQEIPWLNSSILINHKPIYWAGCINKGIMSVKDFYDCNNPTGIKNYIDFVNEFNSKITWLDYQSITNAFPLQWRTWLKGNPPQESPETTRKIWKITNMQKISNYVYRTCINYDAHLAKYAKRWLSTYDVTIDPEAYKKAFSYIYQQISVTKFRDFQYRLLLCKIPCNKELHLWKILDTNLCTFCKKEVESFFHLFIDCIFTKRIWNAITKLIDMKLDYEHKKFVLNNMVECNTSVINAITLITKQYLYRRRCLGKLPTGKRYKK